ncbi:CHAT domain-containing protein [Chloroflexales bacterium ZM16-3]|nr:CHAT domain-containing protein [Chloroflexales bacterium ZM16-3]
MSQVVDFELVFGHGQQKRYTVTARLSPDGGTPATLATDEIDIDQTALLSLTSDARAYGRALTAMVFSAPMQNAWHRAMGYRSASTAPLHLRLSCDLASENLQALRWETLVDPRDSSRPLALSTGIWLSRTLDADDPAPPAGPASSAVVALVAAPRDSARFNLAQIDVAGQIDTITAFCAHRPTTILARELGSRSPTRANLMSALRASPGYVYLVAHGVGVNDEIHLWLEDDAGLGYALPASELVRQVADLRRQPELIVLMVCRGAGLSHSDGWLSTLGARLIRAGVPAVLAMQGDLSLASGDRLGRALFSELDQHCPIEQAVAIARGVIAKTDEWWLPVLFTRSGRAVQRRGTTAPHKEGAARASGIHGLDYERGLHDLKRRLSAESMAEYLTLEARLRENIRRERLFGGTESIRSERAEIIFALNELALSCCHISFNEMCTQ